jgi:hypothetical protein
LRTSPTSSVWLKLQEVEILEPALVAA